MRKYYAAIAAGILGSLITAAPARSAGGPSGVASALHPPNQADMKWGGLATELAQRIHSLLAPPSQESRFKADQEQVNDDLEGEHENDLEPQRLPTLEQEVRAAQIVAQSQ